MTPTTPPALHRYRSNHRIEVVREWDEDMGRFTEVCGRDGIRLYVNRDGRRRHDPSEIRQLAALERGETIDWTIR